MLIQYILDRIADIGTPVKVYICCGFRSMELYRFITESFIFQNAAVRNTMPGVCRWSFLPGRSSFRGKDIRTGPKELQSRMAMRSSIPLYNG